MSRGLPLGGSHRFPQSLRCLLHPTASEEGELSLGRPRSGQLGLTSVGLPLPGRLSPCASSDVSPAAASGESQTPSCWGPQQCWWPTAGYPESRCLPCLIPKPEQSDSWPSLHPSVNIWGNPGRPGRRRSGRADRRTGRTNNTTEAQALLTSPSRDGTQEAWKAHAALL